MKKHCLSWLAKRTVPPERARAILLVTMAFLAQARCGPLLFAAVGDSLPVRRAGKSDHPYLPVLGPTPLRIQTSNATPRMVMLPPLLMEDPPPQTNSENSKATEAGGAAATLVAATLTNSLPSSMESNALVRTPLLNINAGAGIITPQMLVQFFKPLGSNNLGGLWSVPVFVPPSPPPPKSSTATYHSP